VCEETSCVENQNRQSCCYEQRKLPGLEDRQSCCHEQRKLPDMENQNDCCAAHRGSISSKEGMLLLGPTVSVGRLSDCCATLDGSISSEDGMSSLGPAVGISVENADRIVCELPVKSTAEPGYKVDQSDSQRPSSSVTVFPCPHLALASSSKAQQDTDELPFHQQEIALNDTESSIVQHDKTDSEQFEGAVEQGLSVPRNEVSSVDVCNESVENVISTNGEEILYSKPTPAELPQSGIQPDDTPRRPARAAARPSRFRDDQFETEFRPGPRKNRVRQVHFDPGKGESTAVEKKQPHTESKAPARQGCQILGKGESNSTTLGNSKQVGLTSNSSIQFPSDHHYLLRKNGHRLGWPTWPKIRFKSHVQSRWKSRFRTLSRRSIRFKPPPGSCKLSRDTYRVRMLNRSRVIRFGTHYQSKPTVRKKQQSLLRSRETASKDPLHEGTFRVRTLNRSSSAQFGWSMFHLQPHPVHDYPAFIGVFRQ